MIDAQNDDDASPASGPGPFPQSFAPPTSMQPPMQPGQGANYPPTTTMSSNEPGQVVGGVFNGMNHLFNDPYDPMIDSDPFGLTASMHFPTMYDQQR